MVTAATLVVVMVGVLRPNVQSRGGGTDRAHAVVAGPPRRSHARPAARGAGGDPWAPALRGNPQQRRRPPAAGSGAPHLPHRPAWRHSARGFSLCDLACVVGLLGSVVLCVLGGPDVGGPSCGVDPAVVCSAGLEEGGEGLVDDLGGLVALE